MEWDNDVRRELVSVKKRGDKDLYGRQRSSQYLGVKGCGEIKSKQKSADKGPYVVGKWLGIWGIGLREAFKNQGQNKRCCNVRG